MRVVQRRAGRIRRGLVHLLHVEEHAGHEARAEQRRRLQQTGELHERLFAEHQRDQRRHPRGAVDC